MKTRSIRWRLPLTYAGIALVTALILGGVLLLILRHYYADQEYAYMDRNAVSLSKAVSPVLEGETVPSGLTEQVVFYSFLTHSRVRILDNSEKPLADSGTSIDGGTTTVSALSLPMDSMSAPVSQSFPEGGAGEGEPNPGSDGGAVNAEGQVSASSPDNHVMTITMAIAGSPDGDPSEQMISRSVEMFSVTAPVQGVVTSWIDDGKDQAKGLISVIPVVDTLYGYETQSGKSMSNQRSAQVVRQDILASDGNRLGIVEISMGPAYGSEIVSAVAWGWMAASLLAITAAGGLGYWFSRKITQPVITLAAATQRMSQGDLSVRARVDTRDELGELSDSFNRMVARVEQTVSALKRFASDAAHELQTPMTALRTNLELAMGNQPVASVDPALQRAYDQLQRLETLTGDLLDLSRIEAGSETNGAVDADLVELVEKEGETAASQAEQKGLSFEIHLPDAPVTIHGWPTQISRAIRNLLENAIKFSPTGALICLELQVEGKLAKITVIDHGLGIPPDELLQLFNRFHRGRNAAGYPGSGLGLAIVKAIADRHGGRVSAASEPGQTTFTLCLPAVSPVEAQIPAD